MLAVNFLLDVMSVIRVAMTGAGDKVQARRSRGGSGCLEFCCRRRPLDQLVDEQHGAGN
jgi:hypothetical protein